MPLPELLLLALHVRVDGDDLAAAEDSKVVPVVARLADAGGRPLVPLRVREGGRAERQANHSKELQRVGSVKDLKRGDEEMSS